VPATPFVRRVVRPGLRLAGGGPAGRRVAGRWLGHGPSRTDFQRGCWSPHRWLPTLKKNMTRAHRRTSTEL